MISRYEATLNGVALSSISPDILILDISYRPASIQNEVYTTARRQGARIYRRYSNTTSCTITFEIHAYDIAERQVICNAIQTWARKGGVLQTNDRPGQRLRCICETFPAINSVKNWTEALSITFTAYDLPFWEQYTPTSITLTGTSGSGTLYVPGCVEDAPVEADITAQGTVTSLNLTVNGRTLTLSGISVTSGQVIKIAYDDEMIQSIKVGNTSLLNRRTGVDDLLVNCGEDNSFSFSSNAAVSVKYMVRGLWV